MEPLELLSAEIEEETYNEVVTRELWVLINGGAVPFNDAVKSYNLAFATKV